ncbi:MAG: hypothetical protein LDL56_08165, partial [Armatimonadetes bacterium]|nr:hypothetical protein [Armatimonadota bacterium]
MAASALLAVLTLAATVLSQGPLHRLYAAVQDEVCAATKWELLCPRPGRVILGSPEIYTRERLVDDRLEHINWLNQQLRGLEDVGREPFRALGVITARDQRTSLLAAVGPGDGGGGKAPATSGQDQQDPRRPAEDIAVATVSRYRQMSYFRELLRAERTRATLDDRHDIEGNTILQVVFDTTVVPPANRRGFALVAVRVGGPPHPEERFSRPEAVPNRRHLAEDWERLYADWLLTLERDIDSAVQQRQLGLLTLRDFRSREATPLLDLRPLLATRVCVAAARRWALAERSAGPFDEERMIRDCFDAFSGAERGAVTDAAPGSGSDPRIARFARNLRGLLDAQRRLFDQASQHEAEKLRGELAERLARLVPALLPPGPPPPSPADQAKQRDSALAALQRRLPSPRVLWDVWCRLSGPDGRLPRVETFRARQFLAPDELARIEPALWDLEIRVPCTGLFRPLEEAALLHALAEHLHRLHVQQRPSPTDDPIYKALVDEGANPAGPPLCVRYTDHAFLPADADQHFLREGLGSCPGRAELEVPVTHAAVSCAAAHIRRVQLSLPGRGAGPGAKPLAHFVHLEVLPGAQGHCRLEARPRQEGPARLYDALHPLPAEVYAYGLSPRNATQRIESRIEDSIALSVLATGPAGPGSGAAREAVATLAQRFVGAQDTPFVVGFGGEAAGGRGLRSGTHAGFGWIIAPRRSGIETDTHTLEMHTLSAVLSVPAWWRRMSLEIRECWIPASGLPEAAEVLRRLALDGATDAADPRRSWVEDRTMRASCQSPRTLYPRVPGGEADLTRALRIEVIRTPYVLAAPAEPESAEAVVGQRASFRIAGGRLWRSTAVTLAGQAADRIRILPNMMGIIAEFDCVGPPRQVLPDPISGPGLPPGEARAPTGEPPSAPAGPASPAGG